MVRYVQWFVHFETYVTLVVNDAFSSVGEEEAGVCSLRSESTGMWGDVVPVSGWGWVLGEA